MRHLIGDKTDLRTARLLCILAISAILLGTRTAGQIPLNGFTAVKKFNYNSGFNKILTSDFNRDSQTDLFLYNTLVNNSVIQELSNSGKNPAPAFRSSVLSIWDIKPIIQIKRKEVQYFAISQRERKAVLMSISRGGGIRINAQFKFDAYPTSLAVADVNGDGNSEAAVSGNNFTGISLFLPGSRFREIKIVEDGVYSSIQFIDLNYDGFPDIAAYDARRNQICLFYNDQLGNFRKARTMKFDPTVKGFKTADINSDGYMDIVLLKNNGLYVAAGDSVSSFKKEFFIKTPVTPDELAVDDFNNDGFNDLAFINKQSGEFFLQLSKGNGSYYNSILLLKSKSLADIKSYRDGFQKKIVLLDPDGKLFVFSRVNLKKEFETVSAGGDISALSLFNYQNRINGGLGLIDNYQNALIMLISEPGNPLAHYYSVRVSSQFNKMLVCNAGTDEKIFYLYSLAGRLVDVIKYNFKELKAEKRTIHFKEPIEDINLKLVSGESYPSICVLTGKNDPNYFIYEYDGNKFTEQLSARANGKFIKAVITASDTFSVITWNKSNYGAECSYYSYNRQGKGSFLYKFNNKVQDNFELVSKSFMQANNTSVSLSLIVNGNEAEGVLIAPPKIRNLNFDLKLKKLPNLNTESPFIYSNEVDKRKILFIYDFGNSIFYRADLMNKSRILSLKGSDKIDDLISYTVDKGSGKKLKLIYITSDKFLNFKEIE